MTLLEVVAAALVHDGRVLAGRRSRPAQLAGGWEFPGGKVEPGEDARAALARECQEELGIKIEVGECLGTATDSSIRLTLLAAAVLAGEPQPHDDHDELRWLAADELDSVAWLPIDRELLPSVGLLLRDQRRWRTL